MPLSEDQQQSFQNWATARGVTHFCPACGLSELSLSNEMTTVLVQVGDPEFAAPELHETAQMPLAQVICGNCAYTMSFAAGLIGMVQHGAALPAPVG